MTNDVLGKRRPEFVQPYVELLQKIWETDDNRVVRIHCLGAIKATLKNPDHIRDNIDIFDFTLTDDEMAEIAKLDGTKKYYVADNEMEEKYVTMHLPFEA